MASGNVDMQFREWQCPPAAIDESRRLGWLNESVEEGQAWLKSQRGYTDFRKSLDTLSGMDTSVVQTAAYRSKLNPNPLKRNVREVIGALAKIRPIWGYHSDNKAYSPQAEMFNKVTQAWYLESMADRAIRGALQWAASTNRGWVRPVYRRTMYGTGQGDISLMTYGSPSVLPVQLPSSGDFQSAYVMNILDEMPVAMAHGMFPMFQDRLRPASSRYWYMNDGVRKAAQGNWMQRAFGRGQRKSGDNALSELVVPIRYSYVIDLSINTTDKPIPMGEPGSSWAYTVPFRGQRIAIGVDKEGHETFREANENDARLYPGRRLIISSDSCICYDGPSFDWHGMFPGVSFCPDDWPWEPIGFSLVRDGFDLNEAIKTIARGNMDKIVSSLDMSLAYDINAVAKKDADAFDPMQPRGRVGFDGSALEGQPFTPVIPPEVLKVTPESMTMVQWLQDCLDRQLGVRDAMTLAKMRSVGSMDELEKAVEANGPIIEDISRSMEPPMRDLGVMVKYLIMQYYTTPRVMQIVGADGVSPQVFDYDPSSLIPSHAPGENPDSGPSKLSPRERARIFADNLRFLILPNTLHEMSQMTMKLGLIQLKKAGVMIDSQTIAEAWNIPNYGKIDGNTVLERYKREQEQQLEFAARMKQFAEGLGLGTPGAPPGAPGAGGGAPEGRPSTNAAPASIQQKDGGARSTVSTSK
jgi:hypothetical protein